MSISLLWRRGLAVRMKAQVPIGFSFSGNLIPNQTHWLAPSCLSSWLHPNSSQISLQGHLAMSGDISGCHHWGIATGMSWTGASNAARCPVIHKTIPTTMNYPTQNVSYTTVEKPCLRFLEVQIRYSTKDCWRRQASSYHLKFYSEIQDSKRGRERRTPTSNSFTSPCGQRSSHSCSSPLPQRRIVTKA